jgi:hypothetical protein
LGITRKIKQVEGVPKNGTIALDNMASDYTQKTKSDQVSWKVLLTK